MSTEKEFNNIVLSMAKEISEETGMAMKEAIELTIETMNRVAEGEQ